jgi:hypothetical protein
VIDSSTCDYGKINAWELCTYEMYENIQTNPSDADYFLHLLFSHASERVKVLGVNNIDNWVHLRLEGPHANDDHGRLTASFKLSRNALFDCLPEEKDRDAFADQLWELSYNEADSAKACEALYLHTSNRS